MERINSVAFATKNLTSIVKLVEFTPDVNAVFNIRVDLGKAGGYLNGATANLTAVVKVTRDGAAVEAFDAVYAKRVTTDTRVTICIDTPIVVQANEKVEVFVLSSNASDTDVDGDVHLVDIGQGSYDAAMSSAVQQLTGLMSLFNVAS